MSDARGRKNVTTGGKKSRKERDIVPLGTNDRPRLFMLPVPDFAPALRLPNAELAKGFPRLNDLFDGFKVAAEYALRSDWPIVLIHGSADKGLGVALRIINTDQIVMFAPKDFYAVTSSLLEKVKKNMGVADPMHEDLPGGPFACYELPDVLMPNGDPVRIALVAYHREGDNTRANRPEPKLVTAV